MQARKPFTLVLRRADEPPYAVFLSALVGTHYYELHPPLRGYRYLAVDMNLRLAYLTDVGVEASPWWVIEVGSRPSDVIGREGYVPGFRRRCGCVVRESAEVIVHCSRC